MEDEAPEGGSHKGIDDRLYLKPEILNLILAEVKYRALFSKIRKSFLPTQSVFTAQEET